MEESIYLMDRDFRSINLQIFSWSNMKKNYRKNTLIYKLYENYMLFIKLITNKVVNLHEAFFSFSLGEYM